MRLRASTAALALVAALALPAQAAGGGVQAPPIPSGRSLAALVANDHALLALRGGPRAERLVAAAGGRLVSAALRLWRVDGGAAARLVPALSRRGLLRYAEPDRVRARDEHLDQGDPLLGLAWHLTAIGADRVEPPGPGVPVTIVDTGIDLTHPELVTRPDVVLLNEQSVPAFGEEDYHGTIVASTIGAPSDGIGTVGVYPSAVLRSYDLARLEDSDIIAGIDAAIAAGPSVINLSLGGPGFSRALYEAVMRAVGTGSLVVAAAGNDFLDGDPVVFPADFPHVLTVAATDTLDFPAVFSSSSAAIDLAAPGVGIPVQDPADPGAHRTFHGTSVAAPIVSAAAAWVWTARPELDPTQLFELLRRTARDVAEPGFDERAGFGILSIPDALQAPALPRDPQEPNDDVDLVEARGVFQTSKPPLTGPGRRRAVLVARIDAAEDPGDVYRVFVPAGRTLQATVSPDADVGVTLWHPRTRTVSASGSAARRNQLASSDRPGRRTEALRWRNATGRGVMAFLEIWLPHRSVRAGYTLQVRTI